MIVNLVDTAVASGARRAIACRELSLDARTLERWRAQETNEDRRSGPRKTPSNKLSPRERARVIATASRIEYCDLSPKQLVPRLADEGVYIASESTFYRVLREEQLLAHRGRSRRPSPRTRPNHAATRPGQVWSWDITYLRASVRGQFHYLYLMMDIWSRKIVGFRVEDAECTDMAAELLSEAMLREGRAGTPLVLHADNGSPMKGATMKATMEKLGVLASYSRPSVSDDNPFSESLFRTLKYCPEYPSQPFASLSDARAWVARFVSWYNEHHLHSGIGFVTPSSRHTGRANAIWNARTRVYAAAQKRHPERWTGSIRSWKVAAEVRLTPEEAFHERRHKVAIAA